MKDFTLGLRITKSSHTSTSISEPNKQLWTVVVRILNFLLEGLSHKRTNGEVWAGRLYPSCILQKDRHLPLIYLVLGTTTANNPKQTGFGSQLYQSYLRFYFARNAIFIFTLLFSLHHTLICFGKACKLALCIKKWTYLFIWEHSWSRNQLWSFLVIAPKKKSLLASSLKAACYLAWFQLWGASSGGYWLHNHSGHKTHFMSWSSETSGKSWKTKVLPYELDYKLLPYCHSL